MHSIQARPSQTATFFSLALSCFMFCFSLSLFHNLLHFISVSTIAECSYVACEEKQAYEKRTNANEYDNWNGKKERRKKLKKEI